MRMSPLAPTAATVSTRSLDERHSLDSNPSVSSSSHSYSNSNNAGNISSNHNNNNMTDVEMTDATPSNTEIVTNMMMDMDMGYEEHHPMPRRGSMTPAEEQERRASIKAILADPAISPMAKRRSIQHLMDGRRYSTNGSTSITTANPFHNNSGDSSNSSNATPEIILEPDTTFYTMNDSPFLYTDNGNQQSQQQYQTNPQQQQQHHQHHQQQPPGYSISNDQTKRAEQSRPTCTHYARKCSIIAPCCGACFGCRICHDDCPVLPPKINNGGTRYHRSASLPSSFTAMLNSTPQDNHHTIDRFMIREVICRECFARQSSKTNNCVSCGLQFGEYHCNICNLWMSAEESPFHCSECGFCRVGGAQHFLHCHACGMCIDKTVFDNHNCKAGKYRSNCPVCQEYLFSSRAASHEMPCGHAIHWDCFRQLAAHDSRCPVCKKTAETRERMMPTWNAMAAGVALQPVPPELARVVNITCNDCEKADMSRAWHFLGIQCHHCSSFNTVVDDIVLTGEEAHEFLEMNAKAQELRNRNPRRRVNRRRSAF